MSSRCRFSLALAVLLASYSLARAQDGLVGYWDFETGGGLAVTDGQGGWGTSPLDPALPQPLAHYNFETVEGVPVADGQNAVGVVDDTAGHPDGPFHGFAVDPASLNEGLSYSADTPAELTHSSASLEIDEQSGVVESFSVPMEQPLADITQGDFTFHTWFKSTDEGRGVFWGSCCTGDNQRVNFELHTGNRVRVWINGPSATTDLNVAATDVGNSRDGEWHSAAAVRRGDRVEVWFDGVMIGEADDVAGPFTQSQPTMFFGRDSRTDATRFDGKLDDAAMWNEALTAEQLQALAGGGSPLADGLPATVLYFAFETREGAAVTDGQLAVGQIDEAGGLHGTGEGATGSDLPTYEVDFPPGPSDTQTSLRFDESLGGISSYTVEITEPLADITQGDFTLHTWFKTTDTGRGAFFGTCCTGDNSRVNLELHTDNRVRLWLNGPTATTDLNVSVNDVGNSRDGKWHAATAVRRGAVVELWFDGVKVGERDDVAGAFSQSQPTMFFGRDSRTGGTQFDGQLDQVTFWDLALEPEDIVALAIQGRVDEVAGHPDGPFHGSGRGLPPPPDPPEPDGLNYSSDVPAALAASTHSLQLDESNGDESFSVEITEGSPLADYTLGDFTIHTWFRTSDTGRGVFLGTCCGVVPRAANFELAAGTNLRVWINGETATTDFQAAAATSRDGEWHSAAAVRRGDTVELWYDGVKVQTAVDVAGSYSIAAPRYYFGRDDRLGATQFSGNLDDIAMWNTALSDAELEALAAGTAAADLSLPAPFANWTFETKDGAAVTDGQLAVGRVDETAGHAAGPFHGDGVGDPPGGVPSVPGLNYSGNTPDPLAHSNHSLEFEEAGGDQSFGVPVSGAIADLTLGDFTMQTWFKTTDVGRGVFFGSCCTGDNSRVNFELHTSNRVRLWLNGPSATSDLNVTATTNSRDDQWHWAAAVRRGDMVEVWYDGDKIGEAADIAGSFTQSQPTMFFGRDSRVGATQFDGSLDDVAFWNIALTPEELAVLAGGGSPLDDGTPSPVAYWAFETREGEAVADGDLGVGQVDETAGDAGGPYHGTGVGDPPPPPPGPPDGLTYSADTPDALGHSAASLEIEERNGDESFSVPMAPALAELTLGDFTLHSWFKSADTGRGGIFGTCCTGSNSRLNLEIHTDNRVRVWINGPSATTDLNLAATPVGDSRDNQWHPLTAVRRGATVELWFDGEKLGETADVAGPFTQSQPIIFFGRDSRLGGTQFSGKLDDIAMWNVALAPAEIEALASGAAAPSDVPFPDEPPAAPQVVTATGEENRVTVDWADNVEDDLASYTVYRSTTMGGPHDVLAMDVSESIYVDTDVTSGVEYCYVVTAVDQGGNESDQSGEACGTPVEPTAPAAPTGLAAVGGDAVVQLDWDDNTEDDLAFYKIYRSTDPEGPFVTGPQSDVSEFEDRAVQNNRTYYYYVTAVDMSDLESDQSDVVEVSTDDTLAPDAPAGLAATAGDARVDLDWDDNTEDDLASYTVYRSTSMGGPHDVLAAGVTESAHADESAENGTTYYYVVSATDTSGNESNRSAEVVATPQEPGGGQVVFDCNQDGRMDISDPQCLLGFLFLGTPELLPCGNGLAVDEANTRLMDWNGDGRVDISDATASLGWLFLGGPPHVLDTGANGTTCIRIVGCDDICTP